MQWRERNVLLQVRQHLGIDQHRPVIFRAAVHDAMTDRDRIDLVLLAQPGAGRLQSRRYVGNLLALKAPVDKLDLTRPACAQSRLRADAVHLSLDLQRQVVRPLDRKYLKLDAR